MASPTKLIDRTVNVIARPRGSHTQGKLWMTWIGESLGACGGDVVGLEYREFDMDALVREAARPMLMTALKAE